VTAQSRSDEHGEIQATTAVTIRERERERERERDVGWERCTRDAARKNTLRCAEAVQRALILKHVFLLNLANTNFYATIGELV
jgi:hypothetical protein